MPEEIIGKKDSDFYSAQKNKTPSYRINDYKVIDMDKPCFFEETEIINGKKITTLSVKTPIKNKYKKSTGIFGISLNIKEQKSKIDSLRNELDYTLTTLKNIISSLPGHVYWLDTEHVIRGCNTQQAKSAGLNSPEDMIGKTILEILPEHQAREHEKINRKVFLDKKEHSVEETSTLANGRTLTFISKKAPLFDRFNNVNGVLGLSLDITDLKEAQEKAGVIQMC